MHRKAQCPHCHRTVQLTSYDTRLWFVVVFIPIIPLGRKRIVDKCPSCSRHYAIDADKWETAKQLEVSGAEEKFRISPTPENAIAVHQQLVNFHQLEEAAAFREHAGKLLPESAMLQAYFGDSLTHFGQLDEATPFYARALALRSDLPQARSGVADSHIRAGRLDEAHQLLDFLEKPGAGQLYPLSPLENLALAYQKAGRHEDALALFARLQEELPKISAIKAFRAMVKKSEKAIGRKTTILPKAKFDWRNVFKRSAPRGSAPSGARMAILFGVVVSLIALGLVIANENIRRHRTVHLVNAYAQPATIEITGTGIKKQFRSHDSVVLPEGNYHAIISGPVSQEFDFKVGASYFSRWSDDPAWLINVGGDTVLISDSVIYQQNPPPASVSIHFGSTFEHFGTVTHPFTTLPDTVQLNNGESRTLVDLQVYRGAGQSLFFYLLNKETPARALQFAECWLHTHPTDDDVMNLYTSIAAQEKAFVRAEAYLRPQLAKRPVQIAWHRAYQEMVNSPSRHAALIAEYDGLLAAAPTDSGLLYLRGRIDGKRTVTRDLFERSIAADARNPFPIYGLAYDRMAAGDWAAAKSLIQQVLAIDPKNAGYEQLLTMTRLALGEAAAVEQETRDQIKKEPFNALLHVRLINALAAQDRATEAMQVNNAYLKLNSKRDDARETADVLRRHALYATGDFAALEKASPRNGSAQVKSDFAHSLIEQGRLLEAVKALPPSDDNANQLIDTLALAIVSRQSGDTAQADHWLAQSREMLANGNEDDVQASLLLSATEPPSLSEARELALRPQLKAILLLAVTTWHPETRAELTPLIRQLNVERTFPFHLVRRGTL